MTFLLDLGVCPKSKKESNWKILQKRFGGTDFVVIDNDNKRYPLAERHPNAVHHYTIMNHNRVYVVGVTQCSLICFVGEIELPHSGPPIPGE